ncbi:molybdate ABC transporter, periplasmic molybdate-binding protein [Aeromicrobium marinum DSM 15272]|uniref:Molybdate ABC transporter, periplasmic molybdate-binding protein n=1 Tax=Aeromicrobium marinum DSM 15272 TaxID=585531 RepID=E2SBG4_9ACTN|nr:molybdate ABC transporter substrate-binding protein [Aeromicrobium marinum]EFQ83710.1 molybdate ABC transporter, periplasmic molybdate-binding protein [Aeromicrobium marinum DSM 15272]
MRRLLLTAAVLFATTSCGSDPGAAEEVTLTVFAAASLTATFEEIAEEFESANEGVTVRLSLAGSSDLVAQLQQGAPADVFASADERTMAKATDDDLIDPAPRIFATNTLVIATPPGNPAGIAGLADLADEALNVVVCAPEVPCGAATERVGTAAGVEISADSEEQSVTDVLGKVRSGEADAGLVYVTDAAGAGDDVERLAFAESGAAVNRYPIGVVAGSPNADLAAAFAAFVRGTTGQRILGAAGFGLP